MFSPYLTYLRLASFYTVTYFSFSKRHQIIVLFLTNFPNLQKSNPRPWHRLKVWKWTRTKEQFNFGNNFETIQFKKFDHTHWYNIALTLPHLKRAMNYCLFFHFFFQIDISNVKTLQPTLTQHTSIHPIDYFHLKFFSEKKDKYFVIW